jgi:hypothetical protein
MAIGSVAWSLKMLSGKQVAALIKKRKINMQYLMIAYRKENIIKKSLMQVIFSRCFIRHIQFIILHFTSRKMQSFKILKKFTSFA